MNRNFGFWIAFATSAFVAMLLSAPILLGDCYVTGQDDLIRACLASKRHATLIYFCTAAASAALAIAFHKRGFGYATFLALMALMIAPFLTAVLVRA